MLKLSSVLSSLRLVLCHLRQQTPIRERPVQNEVPACNPRMSASRQRKQMSLLYTLLSMP